MSTLGITFWDLVAAVNFAIGNVAIGSMASAILVYQITNEDDDEE